MKNIKLFIKKFIFPISQNEDEARKEFILNVFLLTTIGLSLITFVINLIKWLFDIHTAISILAIFIIFVFFVFLYILSRKGFFYFVSYCFLISFFLFVAYQIYNWGVDLPAALLSYAMTIVMAGILINTRFAFITTVAIILIMSLIGYTEYLGILKSNYYWRNENWVLTDLIFIFALFIAISVVSYLSNREIEKSLTRARQSESELKKERDLLEIKVEERAKELEEIQAEKMAQLYRFAEFGRISSGLFHDLINPLNAVSLNIEKIRETKKDLYPRAEFVASKFNAVPIVENASYIDKAIIAAKNMEGIVSAVRKQLSRQENKTIFSLNEEIEQVIKVLSHKALKANVSLCFSESAEIKIYGDAIKFNQVALNLIANAIEAYSNDHNPRDRKIIISIKQDGGNAVLFVKDYGAGISEENKQKIFEPFFTTKSDIGGLGIGLSMIKRIVEKDFGGSVGVVSKKGKGATFTIKFPQRNIDA